VHGNWKVANGCPPSTCWVSWEKIKTCTIYTSSEAEGDMLSKNWAHTQLHLRGAFFPESQPPWALPYT